MYARTAGGKTLTFAFPRGLLNDNLMFYDLETGSLWSQMAGRAVAGPLEGASLEPLPALQTSWRHWWSLHPDTDVVVIPGTKSHPYFYRSLKPGERPAGPSRFHDTSELGLGVVMEGRSRFYLMEELKKAPPSFEAALGGRTFRVHFDAGAPAAWITDAEGRLLPATPAYRRAWLSFHPDSEVYRAP